MAPWIGSVERARTDRATSPLAYPDGDVSASTVRPLLDPSRRTPFGSQQDEVVALCTAAGHLKDRLRRPPVPGDQLLRGRRFGRANTLDVAATRSSY